jgi:hypothetical protein
MPLIEDVANVCRRLGDHGWRDLLLRVTDSALDITAAELGQELAMPLARIDRTVPGFEDFAAEGERGIEPGMPARSLATRPPSVRCASDPKTASGRSGCLCRSCSTGRSA